jgi:hypothetical protein
MIRPGPCRMMTISVRMTRRKIRDRLRRTKPRGRPLRSSHRAPPEGEVQGQILRTAYWGRISMRTLPRVHSLVKPAAKRMQGMAATCKSGEMVYPSKASRLSQRTRRDPTPRALIQRRQISHHCEVCSRFDPSSRVYGNTPWPPKFCPSF